MLKSHKNINKRIGDELKNMVLIFGKVKKQFFVYCAARAT